MEYIIGIILLLSFFGLAYYCIKGHNLMIGFLIITVIWTVRRGHGYKAGFHSEQDFPERS